ncbi:MAG: class I SAM-dependent methyltransferase [bacterium]
MQVLEEVVCNLCGSGAAKTLYRVAEFGIVRCRQCGLVYVSPRLPAERLKREVYDEGYFDAQRGYGIADHFGAGSAEAERRAGELLAEVERIMKPPGDILDVGSAGGFFPAAAARGGWNARAVEIAPTAAEFARKNFGLEVFEGEITDAPYDDETFDAVTMFDVIEHLTNPYAALRKAFRLLRRGGRIFIVTPSFDSLPRRILGADWGLLAPEHHLYYFTPATLRKLVEIAGFKVEKITLPSFGLADLFLTASTLRRAGFRVDDDARRRMRRSLGAIRDRLHGFVNDVDVRVLKPLLPRAPGNAIHLVALKQPV